MMYKAVKVMKETMEPHRYCDVCGEEIIIGLKCTTARCMYCGKDLCEKHIGHEEVTGMDFRSVSCKRCWELGETHRAKVEKLESEISRLYKEWHNICKEGE